MMLKTFEEQLSLVVDQVGQEERPTSRREYRDVPDRKLGSAKLPSRNGNDGILVSKKFLLGPMIASAYHSPTAQPVNDTSACHHNSLANTAMQSSLCIAGVAAETLSPTMTCSYRSLVRHLPSTPPCSSPTRVVIKTSRKQRKT